MDRLCNKYINDKNFNKDIDRALVLEIAENAKNGDVEALAAYSILELHGYGVEKNVDKASARLLSYSKSGDAYGMFLVGILSSNPKYGYIGELTVSEDYLRSLVFGANSNKLDDRKKASAARVIGDYYSGSYKEFEHDAVESFRAYKLAAELGDLTSMVEVGCLLTKGADGLFDAEIKQNEVNGVALLERASSEGCEKAVVELVRYHLRKAISLTNDISAKDESMQAISNSLGALEWRL